MILSDTDLLIQMLYFVEEHWAAFETLCKDAGYSQEEIDEKFKKLWNKAHG